MGLLAIRILQRFTFCERINDRAAHHSQHPDRVQSDSTAGSYSRQLKFLATRNGRDPPLGVNGGNFKGIEAAQQKLAPKM